MKISLLVTVFGLPLVVLGCSASPLSGLTTGSTSAAEEAPKPFVNDTDTRTTQVAWNSARAEKCGFYLDPAKLKTDYLAWEQELGTEPEQIARLDQNYDGQRAMFGQRLKVQPYESYCNPAAVSEMRTDVQRYTVGDFSARPIVRKKVKEAGIFDGWGSSSGKARKQTGMENQF